jgi:hypothetical protein
VPKDGRRRARIDPRRPRQTPGPKPPRAITPQRRLHARLAARGPNSAHTTAICIQTTWREGSPQPYTPLASSQKNTIRRHVRNRRAGPYVICAPFELEPDVAAARVIEHELPSTVSNFVARGVARGARGSTRADGREASGGQRGNVRVGALSRNDSGIGGKP